MGKGLNGKGNYTNNKSNYDFGITFNHDTNLIENRTNESDLKSIYINLQFKQGYKWHFNLSLTTYNT